MKNLTVVFLLCGNLMVSGQVDKYANTYACTKGKIYFYASTPLEDIEATSNSAICVLNTQTKKVYAKVQQASFAFKNKLMQEHFNENYMESEKYPAAVLDMAIAEDSVFSKDGTYDVTLNGTLEMHGVKLPQTIKGKLIIKNRIPVQATAVFEAKLADYKIKVPKAVVMKIAEVVKVDVDFVLEKYQK